MDHKKMMEIHRRHEGEREQMAHRHMHAHMQMAERHHHERHAMHQGQEMEMMGGGAPPASDDAAAAAVGTSGRDEKVKRLFPFFFFISGAPC